ncbi:hypothetical protein [Arcticibacter eurypsychrophilus]|uniref:hypothetical protein n=1 Tax=Arcticibacter eurypsychrophilus TaxID=1434752 RepID=UPI00084DDEE8|nr:hypothetical protein [Arcticibacter eurypsychrophilus]
MKNSFKTEIDGTLFEFHTMNVQRLQLFQVYVLHENEKLRFHMQIDAEGRFKITDPSVCPDKYVQMESALHDAIMEYAKEDEAFLNAKERTT